MDLTLIGYTASVFAALLAVSSYMHWGVAEVHAYTIPPYFEERGYTTRIVANQVVDSMRRIQVEVASLNEVKVVVQGQAQPIGEVASYFGIVELLRATEGLFGLDPRVVAIEITQHDDVAHWRTRGDHVVTGYQIRQGDLPLEDPGKLIDHLGLQIIGYVSPFEALAYVFIQDSASGNYDTTVSFASDLMRDCERHQAWVCTADNIKHAQLLRGMAYLYSDRSQRAFEDFEAASKVGAPTAVGMAFYGDAYAALDLNEEAARRYQQSIDLDAGVGERFYELALGYASGGNHRLAERRFRTAAALGLDTEAFLVAWGDNLHALGLHQEALVRYRKAEAVDLDTELYVDRIDRSLKALGEEPSRAPSGGPVRPDLPGAPAAGAAPG